VIALSRAHLRIFLVGITALLFVGIVVALAVVRDRSAATPPAVEQAAAVKLVVAADGIYEVPASLLREAGFDLAGADPHALTLSAGGKSVPYQLTGQGKQRALRFYGRTLDARPLDAASYTAHNIYWLALRPDTVSQPNSTITTRSATPASGSPPASTVTATVRAEEQRQWVAKADPGQDRWVWQTVFAPKAVQINLALPHALGEQASLRLRAWGNSSAPVNPDHHWVLSLNGTQVADVTWDGLGEHLITATVPAGVVRPGDNQLAIRPPGDTGAPADSVFLDWIEITYTRNLIVDGSELDFAGEASGYIVRASEPPAAIWDITDPDQPVVLNDYQVQKDELRFGAPADGAQRRFWLAAQAGLRRPSLIAAVTPDRLRDWPGGADLIIITAPQFRSALEPLVKARQAQGLRVAVVDVGETYDVFTHGRVDPAALRALVQEAVAQWTPPAPRYLLLAGDASYDPRGYLKGAEVDVVPTYLVDTGFTGWTASDTWFALPAGMPLAPHERPQAPPSLAVGRLPAQTSEQMMAMVNKILAYEQSDTAAEWRREALLVADNDEPGFAEEAKSFAAALSGYAADTATVDQEGAARARLLKAFADGVGLVGYIGHGSLNLWAQEKAFSVEDVAKLSNKDRLPLVLTLTCLSGFFQHPTTVSLGESLLRAPNGGAVAVIAPSSASVLDSQAILAQGLTQTLTSPEARTIGDVLLGAQTRLVASPGGINEILLTYNLLGDPAMRIR
jgi:hypothetical protein